MRKTAAKAPRETRVLMIYYYFPPRGGVAVQRLVKFCKYLGLSGCIPAVLTSGARYSHFLDESLTEQIPAEVEVHATSPSSRAIEGQFRRLALIDAFLPWVPPAIKKAGEVVKSFKPHVIYTTSPPHSQQLIGLYLKLTTGLPWVADFRDPWTHDQRLRTRKGPLVSQPDRLLEGLTLRYVDAVVATASEALEAFRTRGGRWGSRAEYLCIPNGYDPEDYPDPPRHSNSRFTVSYVGSLGGTASSSNPEAFLDALADLLRRRPKMRPQISVRFVGSASRHLDREIKSRGLGDVVLNLEHVTHREAIGEMQRADVLLLLQSPVAGRHLTVIPAKLFEYMGTRKPILAVSSEGDTARIVRDHHLGRVVDPADLPGIAGALEDYHRQFDEAALPAGDEPPDEYSRLELSRRLAGLLHRLADCARVKS